MCFLKSILFFNIKFIFQKANKECPLKPIMKTHHSYRSLSSFIFGLHTSGDREEQDGQGDITRRESEMRQRRKPPGT